jgi:hypothetical protein
MQGQRVKARVSVVFKWLERLRILNGANLIGIAMTERTCYVVFEWKNMSAMIVPNDVLVVKIEG